jgi:hypothetical protein
LCYNNKNGGEEYVEKNVGKGQDRALDSYHRHNLLDPASSDLRNFLGIHSLRISYFQFEYNSQQKFVIN